MKDQPIYDHEFFKSQTSGSQRSAEILVPIVLSLLPIQSVVDVGCGVGTWLQAFRKNGVKDIFGLDGSYVNQGSLRIPKEYFSTINLEEPPQSLHRTFDLAVCLEVAEHLSSVCAEPLVDLLTNTAPAVLFSVAIPGQGGVSHINEQWPEYWVSLFDQRGWRVFDVVRNRVWDNPEIEPWYAQNTFLYIDVNRINSYPALVDLQSAPGFPLRSIHPELFRRFVSMEYFGGRKLLAESLRRMKTRLLGRFGASL